MFAPRGAHAGKDARAPGLHSFAHRYRWLLHSKRMNQMSIENTTSRRVDMLMEHWFGRVRISQVINYRCANFFSSLHLVLGLPSVALSIVVGTAVFVSISKESTGSTKIVLGLVSLGAAVLSSLQTFLRYAERAERHRTTGAKYGAMKRRLELLKALPPQEDKEVATILASIKSEVDHIAESAPEVPNFILQRVKRQLSSKKLLEGVDAFGQSVT